jgi:thiamine pyrophosphokinase
MRHTVVVGNAPWRWSPEFVAMVRAADPLIAADGGANHLARVGVRPDAIVGDLDSILPGVRRWAGEERMVHRPDQDFTDLHKTLAYAIDERRAKWVTLLAVTGGRTDHAVENLALLARWAARTALEAWDGMTRIVPVTRRATLRTTVGQTVSLVPIGRCVGVTARGLRWPLTAEPLDLLERSGISNVATAARAEVEVGEGCLLVFLHGALDTARNTAPAR